MSWAVARKDVADVHPAEQVDLALATGADMALAAVERLTA